MSTAANLQMPSNANVKYRLQYLGRMKLPNNATGLGAVQEPLLELYSNFKTEKGPKSLLQIDLSLNQQGINLLANKIDETYQLASIFFCKSIDFICAKIKSKSGYGFAFQIKDLADPSGILLPLPKKLSYLAKLRHPVLLVFIMRRSNGIQASHVHAFVCQTGEEAFVISNSVLRLQTQSQNNENSKNLFDYKRFPSQQNLSQQPQLSHQQPSNQHQQLPQQQQYHPQNQQIQSPHQQQPLNAQPSQSKSVKISPKEKAIEQNKRNESKQLETTMSSLDIARQIAQCPEKFVEDAKKRKSVMIKNKDRSERSSSFVVHGSKLSSNQSQSQRQLGSPYMLNQRDVTHQDGSEQTHSLNLKLYHFGDAVDSLAFQNKNGAPNGRKDAEIRAIYENHEVEAAKQQHQQHPMAEEFKVTRRQMSADEVELRSGNVYQNDHMKRTTMYSPVVDGSEFNQPDKSKPAVQLNKMFGVRVLPKDLGPQKLKAPPAKYDPKKEKSTDCDSALIPLLCVHG